MDSEEKDSLIENIINNNETNNDKTNNNETNNDETNNDETNNDETNNDETNNDETNINEITINEITNDKIDELFNSTNTLSCDEIINNNEVDTVLKDIDLYDETDVNIDKIKKMLKEKSINYKKKFYLIHLQKKINVLSYKIRFINHKYIDYLLYYKKFNVLVILFSSLLTLFEAFTNMINIEEIENDILRLNLKFIPLIISTIISLLATYIKFQKYQEKMEELSLTEEKSKLAISKLKNVREYLTIKEQVNFDYLEELYFNEVYKYYNDVSVKISIMLDDNDYNKYSKKINKNDIKKEAIVIKKNKELHDIIEKQTSLIDTLSRSNKDLMKNENINKINDLKTTMDDYNNINKTYNDKKEFGICAKSPK